MFSFANEFGFSMANSWISFEFPDESPAIKKFKDMIAKHFSKKQIKLPIGMTPGLC